MADKLKVSIIQMDCKIRDKSGNIGRVVRFIESLEEEIDIVCIPELFSTGYNLDIIGDEYYKLAETIPGPTTDRLREAAQTYRTAIIGSIAERDPVREAVLYDTAFVIDRRGDIAGIYRKYNLYPTEYRFFRPGNSIETIDLDGLNLGLAICFDHAFPELFRILALHGAHIIFIPSAVPAGFEYLLNLRTMARAQDNQVFVVAANRVGTEGDISYCGRSKIVNPRGEVIVEASTDGEEIITGDIDLCEISRERKQEPVFRCLRPELLHTLSSLSKR